MRVFLSHSTSEKDDIQALRKALENRDVAAWEDALELRLGDGLKELREAIRNADAFVLHDAVGDLVLGAGGRRQDRFPRSGR